MKRACLLRRVVMTIVVVGLIAVLSGCPNLLGGQNGNDDEAEIYTVTYEANGADSGTAPEAQTKTEGVDLTLAGNTGNLARTGYTFVGWNSASDGSGTDYAEGTTYTADADLTLYAKWTQLPGSLAAPKLSQPGGDYFVTVEIELSTTDGSASIYYTLDGSEPTESSTEYTGSAISLVPGTTTIRARAYKSDSLPSAVAEAVYNVQDGILVTTDSTSGPGSLGEAITNATSGQEIRFDGSYTINAVDEEAGWEIDTPIIIDGVGHSVTITPAIGGSGNVKDDRRAFTVANNSGLTLKNVTLEDANLSNNWVGGAVRVQAGGSLTVDTVTFSGNSADGRGGAILLKTDTTAVIENSTFRKNNSEDVGGAIFVDFNSSLTIADTLFDDNNVGSLLGAGLFNGGAINISGSSTTFEISDSEFIDNTAMKYGGAIHYKVASGDIVRSEFRRNRGGRLEKARRMAGVPATLARTQPCGWPARSSGKTELGVIRHCLIFGLAVRFETKARLSPTGTPLKGTLPRTRGPRSTAAGTRMRSRLARAPLWATSLSKTNLRGRRFSRRRQQAPFSSPPSATTTTEGITRTERSTSAAEKTIRRCSPTPRSKTAPSIPRISTR